MSAGPPTRQVEVVAAVIQRAGGEFLLAQRPAGKVYAGYWEFPGGKVEPGEPAIDALARELHEELGIEVEQAFPWIVRSYQYEHAHVRLNFFRVTRWRNDPVSREAQAFRWQRMPHLDVAPVLPANGPILRGLAVPPVAAISNASEVGETAFLSALDGALDRGLKLLMLREKQMPVAQLELLASKVRSRCTQHGAILIINGDVELARRCGADGVHFPSAALQALSARPDFDWCSASCHDARELEHAAALGLDFVVLGPVLPTQSHPGATALGWERFTQLIAGYSLPVFALGGMRVSDFGTACRAGAQGIAMIRGAWSATQSFPSDWSGSD